MISIKAFFASIPKLLTILPPTLLLFLAIVAMGILLGLALAAVRIKGHRIANILASMFVSFERSTPLLIQILIVYFGLRTILISGMGIADAVHWNAMYFAFIAYGLNLGAFLSETFRSAFLSIDRGQIEAAQSIGMTGFQVLRRVILPQGARIALPSMANMLLDGFKSISLAFSIGVVELMGRGMGIANAARGVGSIGIYGAVALLFWATCFVMDKILVGIERRLSKDIRVMGTK